MGMKGQIKDDHLSKSKYTLTVLGLPELTAVSVSEIPEELDVVELPDQTSAPGGGSKPTEFTIELPGHHSVEHAAMEVWFAECKGDVSPTYKKSATLTFRSIQGSVRRSWTLVGVFPKRRSTPAGDMNDDGNLATVSWTLSVDEVFPI